MNQVVHKQLGLDLIKKLVHICLFINKPILPGLLEIAASPPSPVISSKPIP